MHYSSQKAGEFFAKVYGKPNLTVLDVGGADRNGSIKAFYAELNMQYICLDINQGPGIDIVIQPGGRFPLQDASVDLVISSSVFEHDPCFWITFKEIARVTKLGGYIYVNAPSRGAYHTFPVDNWRYYGDAGQALAYWASLEYGSIEAYPVTVEETFHIKTNHPGYFNHWGDFVCVWKRVEEKTSQIAVSEDVKKRNGLLKTMLLENKFELENQEYGVLSKVDHLL